MPTVEQCRRADFTVYICQMFVWSGKYSYVCGVCSAGNDQTTSLRSESRHGSGLHSHKKACWHRLIENMQLTINGIINWITYHIHYQMSAAKTFLYSLLKSRILQNNQQNTVNIVIQEFALYFDTWPGTIQFSCNIIWLHYDFVHCHHKWYQDLLSNVLPKFNRKNNVCNLVTLSYVSKYNPPFVRCYRKTHNL